MRKGTRRGVSSYIIGIACLLGWAVLLTGCTTTAPPEPSPAPKAAGLRLLASHYPAYLATAQVVSAVPGVTLDMFLPPQAGYLEDARLSELDWARAQEADALVLVGGGLEDFVNVFAAEGGQPVLVAGEHITRLPGRVLDPDEDTEPAENPYIWLSPARWGQLVDGVAAGLAQLDTDADRRAAYIANNAAAQARIAAIGDQLRVAMTPYAGRPVVVMHPAAAYLAEEAGLHIVLTIERDPALLPSSEDIAEIKQLLDDYPDAVILIEDTAPLALRTLSGRATVVLRTLCQGMASGDAAAWEAAMEANITALAGVLAKNAPGYTPALTPQSTTQFAPTSEPTPEPTLAPTAAPSPAPSPEATAEPEAVTVSVANMTAFQAVRQSPLPSPTDHSPAHFVVSLAGDCTLGTNAGKEHEPEQFVQVIAERGMSWPFSGVREWFATDDLTLVNLEGSFTTSSRYKEKNFNFRAPPAFAEILLRGSIEAVNLANNHTRDFYDRGYEDTIATLTEHGVHYSEDQRDKQLIIGGVRIALLSYACLEMGSAPEPLLERIAALRAEGVQLILVSYHWGEEYAPTQKPWQVIMAHDTINAGADAVIGTHPHVLQGMELYQGKPIFYSLGNFCFGGNLRPPDLDTALIQLEYERHLGERDAENLRLCELRVIPCSVSGQPAHQAQDFRPVPVPLAGEIGQRVLAKLAVGTAGLPEHFFTTGVYTVP